MHILVEVNGDFWHGNPNQYESEDYIEFPIKRVKAKDIWERDRKKYLTASERGYKMVILWESDISKFTDEDLEKYLIEILGI